MALNNTYDARLVQQETALGAGVQILLLALIGTAIGMGPAGWLTGLAFALATWAVLSRALHRSRLRSFGAANRVTLGRATLVGGVTALVADSFQSSPPVSLFVGLTAIALILDGVDGKVARRTGTSTALGARFDMEVDAFLILVLSVYVSMELGPWVLLVGGMRYVFVAAARVWPWLTAALPRAPPARRWRRSRVCSCWWRALICCRTRATSGSPPWPWACWCGRSGVTCCGCTGPRGSRRPRPGGRCGNWSRADAPAGQASSRPRAVSI